MTEQRRTLLIVEDDPALQKQMRWAFDGFETVVAGDRESALAQLRRHEPAVVTMDLGLPPDPDGTSEGFSLLREIHALTPDAKVIVLTGQHDRENALRAVGMGAYDFFAKPFEPELLALTLERAFRLFDLQQENSRLKSGPVAGLHGVISRDPGMLKLCRTIEKLASTNATVALFGESGTGKEVLAKGLHSLSARAKSDSSPSTALRSRTLCSKVSYSGTRKAHLQGPPNRPWERFRWQTAGRYSLMKSGISPWPCRPSS